MNTQARRLIYHASRIVTAALTIAAAAGCESLQDKASELVFGGNAIDVSMQDVGGSAAKGFAKIAATSNGVALEVHLTGLLSGQAYRIVVHSTGNCSSPNGFSAGPPWIPAGALEGKPIQSIITAPEGTLIYLMRIPGVHIDGPDSIAGRSIVVHQGVYGSLEAQPGVPNNRVSCGVIGTGRGRGS